MTETLGQKQRSFTSMIKNQLLRDEGNVPHAYQDSLGYWTIGVGFLMLYVALSDSTTREAV